MPRIIILGRSPMVDDIRRLLPYSIYCRNTDEKPLSLEDEDCFYAACIGSPRSYLTKVETLDKLNIKNWCSLDLERKCIIYNNSGNIIFPSYISPSVTMGKHCLIMPNSTIHHGCKLGNGSNIASGVVLNGDVTLYGNCFIGANTTIKEGVSICENVLIGANSFINQDIIVPGTYFGCPAKFIK